MPTPAIQPSMAAGELSPEMQGRVDLAKYQIGLKTCLNWFIRNVGGASTRPGYAWVGEAQLPTVRARLVGFQFSTTQGYALEFGQGIMRVIMNGGYVLETAGAITGITQANPGVVTQVGHGYTTAQQVWLDGIVGMVQLNRRRVTVTVLSVDTYSIGIDTTGYQTYASGGTGARVFTLATPYNEADLPLLKFVQSADTLTITHPTYQNRNLTRTSHTSWTLTAQTFAPTQPGPTGLGSTSPGPPNNFVYTVTSINDITGEESQFATPCTSTISTSVISFTPGAGASNNRVYRSVNGIFGFIGYASSAVSGFQDTTINPDTSQNPPQANNPFGSTNLFPGCSTYHDGRQWYARNNNQPQTVWATQSLAFNNMAYSFPQRDSDAFVRTIASRQVDEIRFMMSLDVLLLFTTGAVWKCWAGWQDDVIKPSNVNLKPVSYSGICQVPPVGTLTTAIYATASGKRIRDIEVPAGGGVTTRELSILSSHLLKNNVVQEVAYCVDPDGILYWVRDDGVLLAFTYLKEQDIYAWARHTTDGIVESVCAVQENNESILYLIVKRTVGGATKRYVERQSTRVFATVFDSFCLDSAYTVNGWNTDTTKFLTISGATYNLGDTVTLTATGHTPFTNPGSIGQQYILRIGQVQVTVTVTAFTSSSIVSATLNMAPNTGLQNVATSDWAAAQITMSGMWHLEGRTVKVFADGSVEPDSVVTNGTITVPAARGRILAGLGYTCDLETLNIERGDPTMQGRYKTVSDLTLRVVDTRGLQAGPHFSALEPIHERTTEVMGYPTAFTSGDEKLGVDPSWNSNGRICIRQAYPLPATVVAIIPRLEVGS